MRILQSYMNCNTTKRIINILIFIMEGGREGANVKKIALCIPTYEREKIVNDFLDNCADYYLESGIDIYYYDSSINNHTKKLIDNWNKKKAPIQYIKMPENMHANIKVFKIFQGYGLKREYDFIWVCGDAIQFGKSAINDLISLADLKYDVIHMDGRDFGKIGTREYTDYNEYLEDHAWEVTLFGSILLNTRTMLTNVNWDDFEKKLNHPNLINFSHVSFYFTRACQLKEFCALHYSVLPGEFISSPLKKQSGWYNEIFFISCVAWVDTIERLPQCYTKKKEAMIKQGKYVLLREKKDFCSLKFQKIYGIKEFLKYFFKWKKICTVSKRDLFFISITPNFILKKKYQYKKRDNNIVDKLLCFCFEHEEVYIYGAGMYASKFIEFLKQRQTKISGIIVSNGKKNKEEFRGYKIFEVHEMDPKKNLGIVIALKDDLAKEMLSNLRQYQEWDVLYEDTLYLNIIELINY